MEQIREFFKDKNFDENTLAYISNFIEEFDDLFGKYIPREEVLRRIHENLNEFNFVEELGENRLRRIP